ncbi:hypothetical protein Y1Q_0002647 [Alligator mississippiensis]|uniref:Uncharacterized protein n=1 Tax=Alligator mississippiensis TaxID=8496 RepID=A0A151NZC7_ALLMI|nr:hypothetical protein Y1Q_0002647 [Alligator mississippiensis]
MFRIASFGENGNVSVFAVLAWSCIQDAQSGVTIAQELQRSGTGVPEIGKRSRLSSSTCPRSNNKLRSAERVLLCLCFAATPVGVSTRPYLGWFQPHIIEGLCAYC